MEGEEKKETKVENLTMPKFAKYTSIKTKYSQFSN